MSVQLRQKPISKNRQSLFLDIYENGSRQYEYLRLYLLPTTTTENRQSNKETLKLAEAIRAKREIELKNEEYGFTAGFKKKANFIEYFAAIRDGKEAKNTKILYSNTLKHLKEFAGDVLPFSAITPQFLEKFKKYLLQAKSLRENQKGVSEKIAANSAHTYYNRVKSAYMQAVKERIVSANPFQSVDNLSRTDSTTEYLDLAEVKALAKANCSNSEVKRAFLFSCFSGFRLSDVRALKWENVKNDGVELSQKKNGKRVIVPLSETAKALLKSKAKTGEKVFNLPSTTWVEHTLKLWSMTAGIKKHVTFHVSRHTFATLTLTSGNDLYTVSKLLGHSRIETTQIYAKVIDDSKRKAVNSLPTLELPESFKVTGDAA